MKLASAKDSKLFIKGEPGTMTVFPKVESMMTGVTYIFHNDCRYLIQYEDGTAEDANYISENNDFQENLFTFVSTIQDASRAK